jgi:trimethylamine--corrinoid protein Co-methyltransferase
VIGMVNRIKRDITINAETLAENIIEKVAPNGQYLTEPHTVKYCRKEIFQPHVSYRGPMTRQDQQQAEHKRILAEVKRREEAYVPPDIPASVVKGMKDYLATEGIDPKIP